MVVFKRGGNYWADFTVNGQRFRLPLKVTNKQEAANLEKLKIAEAQSHGGLLPSQTARLTVEDAGVVYFSERAAEVSPSTIRLETDAFKQVKRHLGSVKLGSIGLKTLGDYVQQRKAEGIGNRTINMEVGVLRRVLKKFKLWTRFAEDYKRLPEPKNIGRALTPVQEEKLFTVASSRPESKVAFLVALITANTTAGGVELRNIRIGDIDLGAKTLSVRVGKNRFRVRILPLNQTAMWAVEQLLVRARILGATQPDHYLMPSRVSGKQYDPAQPLSRWGWRTAWRKLTKEAGLEGLRPHDLRHHAITKLAESSEASEQTIMSIAGHVSREMLTHYSHIRTEAKRKAVAALDNGTITSQLGNWKTDDAEWKRLELKQTKRFKMVGMGRFELPTPRTPSECSTRLSHIPTVFQCRRTRGGKTILAPGGRWRKTARRHWSQLPTDPTANRAPGPCRWQPRAQSIRRLLRLVTLRSLAAGAEEVLLHLLHDEVLVLLFPRLQTILIEQHLHVVLPVGPGLLADVFIDALPQRAVKRSFVKTFGLMPQLYALHHVCHVSLPSVPYLRNHLPQQIVLADGPGALSPSSQAWRAHLRRRFPLFFPLPLPLALTLFLSLSRAFDFTLRWPGRCFGDG